MINIIKKQNRPTGLDVNFFKTMNEELENMYHNVRKNYNHPVNDTQVTSNIVPVNIIDNKAEFIISAEIPGVSKEQIDITIENGYIIISGEKRIFDEYSEDNFISTETSYGKFRRIFSIPDHINLDQIKAEFKGGILKIILPKHTKSSVTTKKILIS